MVAPPILRPTVSGQISDLGQGGVIVMEPKLYTATWDNVKGEDISQYVVSGEVSCDPQRDNTWTLSATLTLEGWQRLTPFLSWVRPELTVYMPDGTVRHGQLGLYLVLDSSEIRHESGGTVKLDARSPTWLLGAQEFKTKFHRAAGSNRMDAVRAILREAVLTGEDDSASSNRFTIPNHPKTFNRAYERPRHVDRLDMANEILTGTGFYPLWDTETGILTTRRRGTERLRDREWDRVWTANLPPANYQLPFGIAIDARFRAAAGFPSEIVGVINTSPGSADQVNEILIINDDPHSSRYYRRKRAKNKKNRRGRITGKPGSGRGGDKARRYNHPLIDDDATADEVALGLLDELSTKNSTARLTVLPDPTFVAIRETIGVSAWDLNRQPILNDQYLVHRVTYGMTPGALMQIDIGRVEDPDDDE